MPVNTPVPFCMCSFDQANNVKPCKENKNYYDW